MKVLTKPVQLWTASPHIYGYEDEDGSGSRFEYFHTDSSGAHYYDCIASEGQAVCDTDCGYIVTQHAHWPGYVEICSS